MSGGPDPLPGTLVGLSVSESPDLPGLGLCSQHLTHAYLELARQLLAAGARLAYGGDLRSGGFTEKLVDLLNTYSRKDRPSDDRIVQYLAWPAGPGSDDAEERDQLAGLQSIAIVVTVPPTPVPGPQIPDDLRGRVHRAESLTAMRQRMTADIDARIILGGRPTGFQGRFPGVAEEALLTAASGKPLFVLGGFGGCAAAVVDLVEGRRPQTLSITSLRARNPDYDRLVAALPGGLDDGLTAPLDGTGPGGLGNGLDDEENRRLFESCDIDEVIALVLRGLRRICTGSEPRSDRPM